MKGTDIHPGLFQRRIPSRLVAVDAVCRDLRTFLARSGRASSVFVAELLARECLNNAVLHGNRSRASRHVRFEVRSGRVWLRMQVADQGPGFDWRRVRRSLARDPAVPGGRGLALCRMYAARVAFNHSGNQITLWLGARQQEQPHGRLPH